MPHLQTQVLGELPNLKQIELDGNTFSAAPGYKHTVVNHLEGLTRLDGDMVMQKDRDDAAHFVAYEKRRGLVVDQAQHARRQDRARSSTDPHRAQAAMGTQDADDDEIGEEASVSFWTHSEIAVPLDRPRSAVALRRPATSHTNTRQYHHRAQDSKTASMSSTCAHHTQVLAKTLAGNSMAFLEKHHGSKASGLTDTWGLGRALREAGGLDGPSGGAGPAVGGSASVLFKDEFLNNNPILMEYMAQAALEHIDAEGNGSGGTEEGGGETEANTCASGDDDIKFFDIQSDAHVRASVQGGCSTSNARPAVDVAALPVESARARWDGQEEEGEEEEEACLSRSDTSRPASRARRCGGFAAELRQVASTMSAVEAFSVEEISALLQAANQRPPTAQGGGGLSLGEQLAQSLRPLTSSGRAGRREDQECRHAGHGARHAGGPPPCGAGGERGEGGVMGQDRTGSAAPATGVVGGEGELVRRLLKTVERLQVKCHARASAALFDRGRFRRDGCSMSGVRDGMCPLVRFRV